MCSTIPFIAPFYLCGFRSVPDRSLALSVDRFFEMSRVVLHAATLLVALSATVFAPWLAVADEITHTYADNEEVVVYANKMGPFNNPLETYAYFELPMCPPDNWEHKMPSIGQALAGDELYKMHMNIRFKTDTRVTSICTMKPTDADRARWKEMIEQQYWYQLYSDDLPMWATFGKMIDGVPHIHTQQKFSFGVNGNQIVQANLVASEPVSIATEKTFVFTYTAEFVESELPFSRRYERYLDNTFFEHRIHWLSVSNSFMMVFVLVLIVLAILHRTLRDDFAKINEQRATRQEDDWLDDNHGWKQLTNDVFRVPHSPVLLCALIGTGSQLAIHIVAMTIISIVSVTYTTHGSFATYAVLTYIVTSYAAGFFSASQFSRYALIGPTISSQWIKCMFTTAMLYPGTIMLLGFLLNFVAIAYDSAQAIPFGGMVVLLFLWLCVSVPLVVMGTVVGRHSKLGGGSSGGTISGGGGAAASAGASRNLDIPRVNQIPRMIPAKRWFARRALLIPFGGVLPFASIFVELFFVFTSFWNYKVYYVYGFLLLAVIIFVIVIACVSVVSTYLLLNAEDHRWPWTTFWIGASSAVYVFLYSIYYYNMKTHMTGFFMFCFYFTYTLMMCITTGLIAGTVAFMAANRFVQAIYRRIKVD